MLGTTVWFLALEISLLVVWVRSPTLVAHVLRDLHRAELRAAHRAEVRHLVRVLRQGLVVVFARAVGMNELLVSQWRAGSLCRPASSPEASFAAFNNCFASMSPNRVSSADTSI